MQGKKRYNKTILKNSSTLNLMKRKFLLIKIHIYFKGQLYVCYAISDSSDL